MNRNNMTIKGIIVDLNDPKGLKRLKVRIPAYHGLKGEVNAVPDSNLPWCQQCLQTPVSFSVDDTVWLVFEGGDIRYPVIIGALGSTTHFPNEAGETYDTVSRVVNIENASVTLGNKTYSVSGGTLAEVAANIVINSYSESEKAEAYGYIGYDNNGPSIGIMKWHNGYAVELMKNIHEANSSFYEETCKLCNSMNLIYDLYNGTTWYNAHFVPNTAIYTCIHLILCNANGPGKEVQNYRAIGDMAHYLSIGDSVGISDNDSALYHALICYQYGEYSSPARVIRAQEDKSMANLYNVTKYLDETKINSQSLAESSLEYPLESLSCDTVTDLFKCSDIYNCLSDVKGFKNTSMYSGIDYSVSSNLMVEIISDTYKDYINSCYKYNWNYSPSDYRVYTIRGKNITSTTCASGFLYTIFNVLGEETSKGYAKEITIGWNLSDYLKKYISGFEKLSYRYSDIQEGDILLKENKMYAVLSVEPLTVWACNNKDFSSNYPAEWDVSRNDNEFNCILRINNNYRPADFTWNWILPESTNIKETFSKNHKYIDAKANIGEQVVSPTDGVVVAKGSGVKTIINNKKYGKTTNGKSVIINHRDKYISVISHLDTIKCDIGQNMRQGTIIGTSGKTGSTLETIVSFELYDINGTAIDPFKLISLNKSR